MTEPISSADVLKLADFLDKMAAEAPDIAVTDLDRIGEAAVAWKTIEQFAKESQIASGATGHMPPTIPMPAAPMPMPTPTRLMTNPAMAAPLSTQAPAQAVQTMMRTAEVEKQAILGTLGIMGAGVGLGALGYAGVKAIGKGIIAGGKALEKRRLLKARHAAEEAGLKTVEEAGEEAAKKWPWWQTAGLAGAGGAVVGPRVLGGGEPEIKVQKLGEAVAFYGALEGLEKDAVIPAAARAAGRAAARAAREQPLGWWETGSLKRQAGRRQARAEAELGAIKAEKAVAAAKQAPLEGVAPGVAAEKAPGFLGEYKKLHWGAQVGIPVGVGLLGSSMFGGGRETHVTKF